MNYMKFVLIPLFVCFLSVKVNAQNITVDDTKTPTDLVQNILINSSCISTTAVNASGNPGNDGQSFAYFNSGSGTFPFSEGIVLSTSPGKNAAGPFNSSTSAGSQNRNWKGDPDLNKALNYSTSTQATVLEFDFVALTNSISFNYIFASNEYQTYFPCKFSDGFAFLIKEAGSSDNYKNLAILPNTTTPVSSTTVHTKINSVIINGTTYYGCDALNESFFNGYNTGTSPINYAGQTIVMNAQTEVIPNKTYHLKLVIGDDTTRQFNSAVFIEAGSFTSKINFGSDRTTATNNPACIGETMILDTQLQAPKYNFKWFKKDPSDNFVQIPSQTGSTYEVKDNGDYKVEAVLDGTTCTSVGEIKIEYAPAISSINTSLFQCDDNSDGISTFNLTKVDNIVKNNAPEITNKGYYESLANAKSKTNAIVTPEKYTNKNPDQIVFARIENKYGCFTIAEVTLKISNTTISDQNPVAICDEDENQDGFYQFDLDSKVTPQVVAGLPNGIKVNYFLNTDDALTETNPLSTNKFENTIPFTQVIYARAVNGSDCYDIVPVTLVVNTFSPPNFEDETLYLCKGDQITLAVATGFNSYLWNNGSTGNSIPVNIAGDYTVTVTNNNGCLRTKKYKIILSEPAIITKAIVKDFSANENSILLEYTGAGDYEFSLDGQYYQDEPLFSSVKPGIYNVVARDKNGCGLSNFYQVFVLDYPRFFTPNGDTYNDVWLIKNLDQLPEYTISIFDRYGKLLKQMNQNSTGWTGLFNGQQLPADDYWFNLIFSDGRTIKGHFSLKR